MTEAMNYSAQSDQLFFEDSVTGWSKVLSFGIRKYTPSYNAVQHANPRLSSTTFDPQ